MATTTVAGWMDYAILEPSTPKVNKHGEPVQWKVQINPVGTFRCNCPAYIFSGKGGAVRTCKHIRACELDRQKLGVPATQVVPKVVTKPTAQHPQWASAVTISKAMLDQARVNVSPAQLQSMCEVLAAKLAAFVPAKPMFTSQTVEAGLRHITFDDN